MIKMINCVYETPCGWCAKWDKKCDRKITEKLNVEKRTPVIDDMSSTTTHSVKVKAPDWFIGGDRGDILG